MRRRIRGAVAAVAAAASLLILIALIARPLGAQQQSHAWCVTAMDDDRKPVTGLGKEDFSLKDGGARQPVIAAQPATGPLGLGVVFWGFPASARTAETDLVRGITTSLTASNPASRVASVIGTDPAGAPPTLAQAVAAAAGALNEADGFERRALIGVLHTPATIDVEPADALVETLREAQIPMWTIEPPATMTARMPADDALDAAVAVGGGLRWRIASGADLASGAHGIIDLLTTAQYMVTANVPVLSSPPVPIATRHDRAVVLVPMWWR